MLLTDVLDRYDLSRDLRPSSVQQLRFTIGGLSRFLGRPAALADLTSDQINRYLRHMRDKGYAPRTIKGRRDNLITLWRYARRAKLTEARPAGVRKVAARPPAPQAWPVEAVTRLLCVAESMPGTVPAGHKAQDYWPAYIRCAWDTGLRRCDLLRLRAADVRDGIVAVQQEKTGVVVVCRLQPKAVAALAKLGDSGLAWGQSGFERFYRHFRTLLHLAGLQGQPKWLRRSSATAVELDHPGMGGRHLGHRTPGLAEKHYLDQTILGQKRPGPPEL